MIKEYKRGTNFLENKNHKIMKMPLMITIPIYCNFCNMCLVKDIIYHDIFSKTERIISYFISYGNKLSQLQRSIFRQFREREMRFILDIDWDFFFM